MGPPTLSKPRKTRMSLKQSTPSTFRPSADISLGSAQLADVYTDESRLLLDAICGLITIVGRKAVLLPSPRVILMGSPSTLQECVLYTGAHLCLGEETGKETVKELVIHRAALPSLVFSTVTADGKETETMRIADWGGSLSELQKYATENPGEAGGVQRIVVSGPDLYPLTLVKVPEMASKMLQDRYLQWPKSIVLAAAATGMPVSVRVVNNFVSEWPSEAQQMDWEDPTDRRGIDNVRRTLGAALHAQIRAGLPALIENGDAALKTRQEEMRRLGPARASREEIWAFLHQVVRGYEQLARDGVDGRYGNVFFDKGGKTTQNEPQPRKLRANLRNLNHIFVAMITDTPVAVSDELAYLAEPYANVPLPGPLSISDDVAALATNHNDIAMVLFRQRSGPWKAVAQKHVELVLLYARAFVEEVVMHLLPYEQEAATARQRLLQVYVDPYFAARQTNLAALLDTILRPHQRCDTLYEDPLLKKDIEFKPGTTSAMVNMYYGNALQTFIANVFGLVVENGLVQDLPDLLATLANDCLNHDTLQALGAEPAAATAKRNGLQSEIQKLEMVLEECRAHAPRTPTVLPSRAARLSQTKSETKPSIFFPMVHSMTTPKVGRILHHGKRNTARVVSASLMTPKSTVQAPGAVANAPTPALVKSPAPAPVNSSAPALVKSPAPAPALFTSYSALPSVHREGFGCAPDKKLAPPAAGLFGSSVPANQSVFSTTLFASTVAAPIRPLSFPLVSQRTLASDRAKTDFVAGNGSYPGQENVPLFYEITSIVTGMETTLICSPASCSGFSGEELRLRAYRMGK